MFNRQRLTLQLTTLFSEITQTVAIQNFFVISFYTNLSQWKKLNIKNETTIPNEMKFPTVKHNIRRKRLFRYSLFFYQ